MTTHYDTLLVAPTATDDEIRAAFRKLARMHHPDVAGERGAVMMGKINEAYEMLRAESRVAYDLSLVRPAADVPVEEEPAAWGTVDEDWTDEQVDRDTDVPVNPVVTLVEKPVSPAGLVTSISGALLLTAALVALYFQWTENMVEMGNWRITVPFAAVAAIVQLFKQRFGWKLTLMLSVTTMCWPLGSLGVWGFQSWTESLGLLASVAISLLGPATWMLRSAFNRRRWA